MNDDDVDHGNDIDSLKAEIAEIDQQLMLLLGLRFRCTDQLSEQMVDQGETPSVDDESKRVSAMREMALDTGVPPDLAVTLLHAVAQAVSDNHERIKASRSH